MHNTADYHAIEQQIDQDIQSCQTLLQLLRHERTLLKDRDFDTLDKLMDEKTHWLARLEQSGQQRQAWIRATPWASSPDPAAAWNAWLQEIQQPNLSEKWQALKELLDACKSENDVNGKVIARGRQTYQRLVGILRGQDQQTLLYTGKGTSGNGYQAGPLGKA
jgi:flagellar biosynthesis protein FlgN